MRAGSRSAPLLLALLFGGLPPSGLSHAFAGGLGDQCVVAVRDARDFAKGAPVTEGMLPGGDAVSTLGDSSFVSYPLAGNARGSAHIRRMWKDVAGALHVEVDELNVLTGVIAPRQLTAAELAGTRISKTSKDNFVKTYQKSLATVGPAAPTEAMAARRKVFEGQPTSAGFGPPNPPGEPDLMKMGLPSPKGGQVPVFYKYTDRAYAIQQGRLFENAPLASLPKGQRYTFLITEDGQVSYGMVKDGWEYGVKHAHLANGRRAFVGGEVFVTPSGEYVFNLSSGTYTMNLIEKGQTTAATLQKKVAEVFSAEVGASKVKYTAEGLLPSGAPSLEEYAKLCASPAFLTLNAEICGK